MVGEFVLVAGIGTVPSVPDSAQPIACGNRVPYLHTGSESSEVSVEPVASVIVAHAYPPAGVEGPPDAFYPAGGNRHYGSPRLGEDVVAFVPPDQPPGPVDAAHPGSVPVVRELDQGVPI